MEKCYIFLNLGIYQAVEHIVAQEKPEIGKHHFDLACTPDEDGNQLFDVELIIYEDGTWGYGAITLNKEKYTLISIMTINDEREYSLDYDIVSKETFKVMKENESDRFQVEDVLANW